MFSPLIWCQSELVWQMACQILTNKLAKSKLPFYFFGGKTLHLKVEVEVCKHSRDPIEVTQEMCHELTVQQRQGNWQFCGMILLYDSQQYNLELAPSGHLLTACLSAFFCSLRGLLLIYSIAEARALVHSVDVSLRYLLKEHMLLPQKPQVCVL